MMNITNDPEKTVFQLNSEAIGVLQEGRYPEAISKLQDAMALMRDVVHDPAQSGFHLAPIKGYGSQYGNDVIDDVSLISMPIDRDMGHSPSPSNPSDTLFQLFDMAFSTVYMNYQGQRGLRLTTSFLLYNLGLCYHHREVTQGTMNPEKLRIALKFYSRALRIIDGATGDARPDDLTVFLLAVFNNMGYLFAYFGNVEEYRHCIEWIQTLLNTQEAYIMGQTRPDMGFFFSNSIFVAPNNMFNKAAAA